MVRAPKAGSAAQRLERWLSVAIFGAVTVVAVWTSSVLGERSRTELVEAKRASARTIVRVFAASLVAPLDFGDDEGIRAKISDLRTNDQVLYAGVWRENERQVVGELGRTGVAAPDRAPLVRVSADRIEIAEAVLDPTNQRLGTVLVAFTLLPELERHQSTKHRILLISLLLTLAVSAGLVTFVRGRLTRRGSALPVRADDGAARLANWEQARAQLALAGPSGPQPGDVLGQYQLLTCVGEGGMGRVWAARRVASGLEHLVAVKTALRDGEQLLELRHLFMDEARIALLARHPNVCGVHEFGEHEGVLFQVLEWCDGASLRQLLDRMPERRLDSAVAAWIVAKVSAGLHATHELLDDDGVPLHVVHRDVSPQNILIATHGQIQVTDFGVAKALGQLHRPTRTNEVKGKLSYMAPEQVTGQEVDRRADIFALGCILYEATTGHSPFGSEDALSTMYQLLSEDVAPPKTHLESYPEELAAIVLRALAKAPFERYATAEQMGVAIESWLASTSARVNERTVALLMADVLGAWIAEKSRRIEQALALLPLDRPGPSFATRAVPSEPTLPDLSLAVRPTAPAAPLARKPSAGQ